MSTGDAGRWSVPACLADARRQCKRPSKRERDRCRWTARRLADAPRGRRVQRDLLPLPLRAEHFVGSGASSRWYGRVAIALSALAGAAGRRAPLDFELADFKQPARRVSDTATSLAQREAAGSLKARLSGFADFEPTDAGVACAFGRLMAATEDAGYHRPREKLVAPGEALARHVDLPQDLGRHPPCDLLARGPPYFAAYAEPAERLRKDADPSDAQQTTGAYVGFRRRELPALYTRMAEALMLSGFATSVPVVNGLFAVVKQVGEPALRLISDLRRAGRLLLPPPRVRLVTPAGLGAFLRGAVRRRRFAGLRGRLQVLTAKRDVSNYYHRLRLPAKWSRLLALPGVPLGRVRGLLAKLPLWGASGPIDTRDAMEAALRAEPHEDLLDAGALPDDTEVYPLPQTLPMGLPDSVALGQHLHEHLVEPSFDCFFREGDVPGRPLANDEVAATVVVDDLNAFVVTEPSSIASSAAALNAALDRADSVCTAAGLPAKASKTEHAASCGRKVAGVHVNGDELKLEIPEERLRDLIVTSYAVCAAGAAHFVVVEKLICMWTWYALLRRPALSVFWECYAWLDKVRRGPPQGLRPIRLPRGVISEVLVMASLGPLLAMALDGVPSTDAYAFDASHWGAGVVRTELPAAAILSEMENAEMKGARTVLYPDRLRAASPHAEPDAEPGASEDFVDFEPEVEPPESDSGQLPGPIGVVEDALRASWATAVQFPWQHEAHINVLEAEAYLSTLKHIARTSANVGKEFVVYGDSQVVIGAAAKGRSGSYLLNAVLRRSCAVLLAFDVTTYLRYIPTAQNPADGPSRGHRRAAREPPIRKRPGPAARAAHPAAAVPAGGVADSSHCRGLSSLLRLKGSARLRRSLCEESPRFAAARATICAVRRRIRRWKQALVLSQKGILCVMPEFARYCIRELRRKLAYPLAWSEWVEERWLARRWEAALGRPRHIVPLGFPPNSSVDGAQ